MNQSIRQIEQDQKPLINSFPSPPSCPHRLNIFQIRTNSHMVRTALKLLFLSAHWKKTTHWSRFNRRNVEQRRQSSPCAKEHQFFTHCVLHSSFCISILQVGEADIAKGLRATNFKSLLIQITNSDLALFHLTSSSRKIRNYRIITTSSVS